MWRTIDFLFFQKMTKKTTKQIWPWDFLCDLDLCAYNIYATLCAKRDRFMKWTIAWKESNQYANSQWNRSRSHPSNVTLTKVKDKNKHIGHHPRIYGIYKSYVNNFYKGALLPNRVEKDLICQKFLKVIMTLTFDSG